MKNMSTLYQHLRSELVPPRVKTMAAAWQVWDSAQERAGDTIHIDYDGEYGSERVLIVSGCAEQRGWAVARSTNKDFS